MEILDSFSPTGSIVVLTGAGISKESGLATFRDADGVWAKYRIEDVATPDAFARDPARVLDFYNLRRRQAFGDNIRPNAAHRALGALEAFWPGDFLLVTQNIDDLHEGGGSTKLIHMHGELKKSRCNHCGDIVDGLGDLDPAMVCAACGAPGGMRPHVVWFGEMPLEMDRIYGALADCDLFVSIGTSGNVYPAAGFVQVANQAGATSVELNLEASATRSAFRHHVDGPATQLVPAFVAALLARQA